MAPKEGTRAFLLFDSPSHARVLEPAVVESVRDDAWTLAFHEPLRAIQAGEERFVYYSRARRFVRQPVRIESETDDGPPYRITLKCLGEAVEADTRTEDRVETIDCGIEAVLNDEPSCPIQDVSLSGLAVVSTSAYPVGQLLEVAIVYGGERYAGEMSVQGATPLADRRTRYGLLGVFDTPEGRQLKNGLTKMTLEIQNRRLQQRSGAS